MANKSKGRKNKEILTPKAGVFIFQKKWKTLILILIPRNLVPRL